MVWIIVSLIGLGLSLHAMRVVDVFHEPGSFLLVIPITVAIVWYAALREQRTR